MRGWARTEALFHGERDESSQTLPEFHRHQTRHGEKALGDNKRTALQDNGSI